MLVPLGENSTTASPLTFSPPLSAQRTVEIKSKGVKVGVQQLILSYIILLMASLVHQFFPVRPPLSQSCQIDIGVTEADLRSYCPSPNRIRGHSFLRSGRCRCPLYGILLRTAGMRRLRSDSSGLYPPVRLLAASGPIPDA